MARHLTRIRTEGDLKGEPYSRPPVVEAEIDAALALSHEETSERLLIGDRGDQRYLRSECLVHLIRQALTYSSDDVFNRLLPVLLGRCKRTLLNKIPDNRINDAEGLREEILQDFSALFVEDRYEDGNNKLDFFECKFNMAFRTFRLNRLNKAENHFGNFEDPSTLRSEKVSTTDDDALAKLSDSSWQLPLQDGALAARALYDAILELPPDIRNAVILCKYYGYKEESEDPNETTAAACCGCSGRTIRNRLTKAKELLAPLKEHL